MKLFEATGEEAIELLADLLDPIVEISSDVEMMRCIQTDQKLKAIKFALKNHPKQIIQIMALCEGTPLEDYHPKAYELPAKLLEILNHPDVSRLFITQVQTEAPSSGLAMESTEVPEA